MNPLPRRRLSGAVDAPAEAPAGRGVQNHTRQLRLCERLGGLGDRVAGRQAVPDEHQDAVQRAAEDRRAARTVF
jgi:hypothetical protein